MHLHIVGICGTFMGGLALIARAAGHRVTGCDSAVYPPMSTQLREQGIELIEGFDAEQLGLAPDLFVIGNIVSRGNPLMEAILNQAAAYISGPQWLSDHILRGQHVLAVAGTHGKTTTSAMLVWILEQAGLAPNYLIGGIAPDLGVSARFDPARQHFVIEADEYDTAFFDKRSKFVHYHPRTVVLNNLEFDHADIFSDLAAIETQFQHLVRTVAATGRIIAAAHDEAISRVLGRGCWTPVDTFGIDGQWQASAVDAAGHFDVQHHGALLGRVTWTLAGEHNRRNALAALAAATHIGVAASISIAALSIFAGVKRRMELRGAIANICVYDDFAHHPTAIATTIAGLREQVGKARILIVLEPRSNTMKLGTMAARLPAALAQADAVFCFGATKGKHALGWHPGEVLAPLGDRVFSSSDLKALAEAVCNAAQPHDHVLVMSNGSFGGIHELLLAGLHARHPSARPI
jgi:UDP-N-acetylmuramate: L-alanyl-gamma-D-glutamyl-meso-diaminopimelate ligase